MKLRQWSLAALGAILAACGGGSNDAPTPVNAAPVISAISDMSITANQPSQAISFSVSDERPGSLAVTATSDNSEVIVDTGLALAGSDTGRSLVVTPIDDTTGDAFVTIFATDGGGLMASTSFLLIVDAEGKSMQQFARDSYATSANDDPELINAVEFDQDADDDDFADLLVQ